MAVLLFAGIMAIQTHGLKLVFEQDFRRLKGNLTKEWRFDDGPVFNGEQEKYVSNEGPNAFITKEGLTIRATKVNGQILSTRLTSKKSWKYGYFEMKAKMNSGRGAWPAFWMLGENIRLPGSKNVGWPKCGEIDIMEQVGFDPNVVHSTLHCQEYNFMNGKQRGVPCNVPTATTEFHRYGMLWTAKGIDFYVDDVKFGGFKSPEIPTEGSWPFNQPFYIILNQAIGGNWGGAKGVDEHIFPADY